MSETRHHIEHEHVQAFQLGEEKAFDFFFRKYYAPLCYFATGYLDNKEDARDLVQECFIKLWSRHATMTKPSSIKSFLYTTVKNACIDLLRKKETERHNREYIEAEETIENEWLTRVVKSEVLSELYNEISALPPRMQRVFRLFYIEGKSYKEIASILKTSPETVKKQKAKALSYLKKR